MRESRERQKEGIRGRAESNHRHHPNMSKKDDRIMSMFLKKNYCLAKELSELRIRLRDECKKNNRLTIENLNLASMYRESQSRVVILKEKLASEQKTNLDALESQREQAQQFRDILLSRRDSDSSTDLFTSSSNDDVTTPTTNGEVSSPRTGDVENRETTTALTPTVSTLSTGTTESISTTDSPREKDGGIEKQIISTASPHCVMNLFVGDEEENNRYGGDNSNDDTRSNKNSSFGSKSDPEKENLMSSIDAFEKSFSANLPNWFTSMDERKNDNNVSPSISRKEVKTDIYNPFLDDILVDGINDKTNDNFASGNKTFDEIYCFDPIEERKEENNNEPLPFDCCPEDGVEVNGTVLPSNISSSLEDELVVRNKNDDRNKNISNQKKGVHCLAPPKNFAAYKNKYDGIESSKPNHQTTKAIFKTKSNDISQSSIASPSKDHSLELKSSSRSIIAIVDSFEGQDDWS